MFSRNEIFCLRKFLLLFCNKNTEFAFPHVKVSSQNKVCRGTVLYNKVTFAKFHRLCSEFLTCIWEQAKVPCKHEKLEMNLVWVVISCGLKYAFELISITNISLSHQSYTELIYISVLQFYMARKAGITHRHPESIIKMYYFMELFR